MVEFNTLCYTENDVKKFQNTDEVLRKLIEIKKGNRAVTNIPSNFSKHIHNIYLIEDILYYQRSGHFVIVLAIRFSTSFAGLNRYLM